jgi:hypothetical protein
VVSGESERPQIIPQKTREPSDRAPGRLWGTIPFSVLGKSPRSEFDRSRTIQCISFHCGSDHGHRRSMSHDQCVKEKLRPVEICTSLRSMRAVPSGTVGGLLTKTSETVFCHPSHLLILVTVPRLNMKR